MDAQQDQPENGFVVTVETDGRTFSAMLIGMPFPFASIRMAEGYWSRERAADFILALLTPSR